MPSGDPRPNNPLSPYFPAEVPPVPGNGRQWFALIMVMMLLGGAAYGFVAHLL